MSSPAIRRITQAGVVGALALSVSGVVVMDKSVALSLDGKESTVHAFGGTVGDVLEKQGIEVGPHDVVSPGVDTPVRDDQEIVVRYARKLTVTVDGKGRTFWTTAKTVDAALKELGLRDAANAELSSSRSTAIGRDGLDLEVNTPKDITFVVGGQRSTETVTAATVEAALAQAEIRHDGADVLTPGASAAAKDGMTIRVDEVDRKGTSRTESIPFRAVTKDDPSMYEGETEVDEEGRAGSRTITYDVTYKNGEQVWAKRTGSFTTRRAVNKVVLEGTKEKPAPKKAEPRESVAASRSSERESPKSSPTSSSSPSPSSSPAPDDSGETDSDSGSGDEASGDEGSGGDLNTANSAMWDRIAECEATGNWSMDSGNGYYGGLQFDERTWLGAGGGDFAPRADQATREEQITVANRVKADRGLSPWGCAGAA